MSLRESSPKRPLETGGYSSNPRPIKHSRGLREGNYNETDDGLGSIAWERTRRVALDIQPCG